MFNAVHYEQCSTNTYLLPRSDCCVPSSCVAPAESVSWTSCCSAHTRRGDRGYGTEDVPPEWTTGRTVDHTPYTRTVSLWCECAGVDWNLTRDWMSAGSPGNYTFCCPRAHFGEFSNLFFGRISYHRYHRRVLPPLNAQRSRALSGRRLW